MNNVTIAVTGATTQGTPLEGRGFSYRPQLKDPRVTLQETSIRPRRTDQDAWSVRRCLMDVSWSVLLHPNFFLEGYLIAVNSGIAKIYANLV